MTSIDQSMQKSDIVPMIVQRSGLALTPSISSHGHEVDGSSEFHYFLGGSGIFCNNQNEIAVSPGSIVYSLPSDLHSCRSTSPSPLFMYWIQFKLSDESGEAGRRCLERFSTSPSLSIGSGFGLVFEDIRRRAASADKLVRLSADHRFLGFLCDILAEGDMNHDSKAHAYVNEALLIMQRELGKQIKLEYLADRLGIDKAHFVRIFKAVTGSPPMKYYLALRIEAAQWRLREGNEALHRIALSLGFRDEFHFSHQFKHITGISPSSWRKKTTL